MQEKITCNLLDIAEEKLTLGRKNMLSIYLLLAKSSPDPVAPKRNTLSVSCSAGNVIHRA